MKTARDRLCLSHGLKAPLTVSLATMPFHCGSHFMSRPQTRMGSHHMDLNVTPPQPPQTQLTWRSVCFLPSTTFVATYQVHTHHQTHLRILQKDCKRSRLRQAQHRGHGCFLWQDTWSSQAGIQWWRWPNLGVQAHPGTPMHTTTWTCKSMWLCDHHISINRSIFNVSNAPWGCRRMRRCIAHVASEHHKSRAETHADFVPTPIDSVCSRIVSLQGLWTHIFNGKISTKRVLWCLSEFLYLHEMEWSGKLRWALVYIVCVRRMSTIIRKDDFIIFKVVQFVFTPSIQSAAEEFNSFKRSLAICHKRPRYE